MRHFPDQVRRHSNYVVRIVADENEALLYSA